jgi:hypothetical protein
MGLRLIPQIEFTDMKLHKQNKKTSQCIMELKWCMDEPQSNSNSQYSLQPKLKEWIIVSSLYYIIVIE